MLIIRLARVGKTKHAAFRLIISEKTRSPKSSFLELLGNYDPHTHQANLKADRIKYWLSQGVQTSDTVHNLLVKSKVIETKTRPQGRAKKTVAESAPASAETKPKEAAKTEEKKPAPAAEAKPAEAEIVAKAKEKREAPSTEAKPEEPKTEAKTE